ncbi:BrxA family protein [Ulvibacter litoralis]|uniref:Putative inner membrane protein n=1 Tax=Ulvibacter litoralis TaxID=227084 RepID=A0A1G7CMM0_9FLAO|nr:BrxA family protein [Ulvibacter litoralis]GHC46787.1 hypothetical protein GCM10008083_07330 [Ulvibacter litoralis]SDE40654.1 Putative inner membrane protein [Ulvibacter litoralis]
MNYNTDINILGGIPNYQLLYIGLPLLISNEASLKQVLVSKNEYNFRTERSRQRFLTLLKSALISDNEKINMLASNLFQFLKDDEPSQALLFFWLFSLNNKLFYELNRDVYLKFYFQGRMEFPKEDVIAYLKDLISRTPELKGRWSDNTIDTIAYKYLSVLKKLHLLKGSRKKTFELVNVNDKMLAVYLNLYSYLKNTKSNFLDDEFSSFSFTPKENLVERIKRVAKKDWIIMNFAGSNLKIENAYEPNDIINGIFGRS